MLLRTTCYARAGLIGNPSDGYFGKTISCAFEEFGATVVLYESPEIQLIPAEADDAAFPDLDSLVADVHLYGYYGGIRLLKATAKVFADYCREHGIRLPARNFTARYASNIPRLVGLGGSSAICTAMFRNLMRFYEVAVPQEVIPTLCWQAEGRELGIQCGLQDRVIQVYEGLVFMDFNRERFEDRGYGDYVPMDPTCLPRLYIAYDPRRAEISGVYHRRLRVLFEEKKPDVMAAMSEFAALAQAMYEALLAGRLERVPELMNANFDLRDRIFRVAPENRNMVLAARRTGASAKFAGSGGAIVGTYEGEAMYQEIVRAMTGIGCTTLKPTLGRGQWRGPA